MYRWTFALSNSRAMRLQYTWKKAEYSWVKNVFFIEEMSYIDSAGSKLKPKEMRRISPIRLVLEIKNGSFASTKKIV